ncbi:CRISPR-associated helicase Cas3' [Sporomusa sp. KB1]|uniref:CRISPR-associated helicase Cas3' n=1 Tax=Sporomusa sp. KB1 TaxID=943346 RepID=UPI0011A2B9FD|nr:CRISPR-associated helicase Cas3' [Sporomusa sp. KB1]TWH47930.1 CRISPR-associated Cas3 family helicase [Sporomusa sp. KB1]
MTEHYAHYDKKTGNKQQIHIHLMNPAELVVAAIPASVHFPKISHTELQEIAQWIYLLHDFGKYTDYFQDYIMKEIISADKGHSYISACLVYTFLLKHYEINTYQEAMKVFVAFICVLRHHLPLQVTGILNQQAQSDQEQLKRQAVQIQNKLSDIFAEAHWDQYIGKYTMQELLNVQNLFDNEKLFWNMPTQMTVKRHYTSYWYFPLIFLFSLLIDMDKIDSAGLKRSQITATEPERVVSYLQEKNNGRQSELIAQRETARKTIISTIDNLTDKQVKEQRFFTLTAPTGVGKTLASLQAALKLQKRIAQLEGYIPKLITAIPFINIIEQTRNDYEAIFSDGLVVHHRLTDFTEQKINRNQEDISVDKQLMLVESWEGKAVLTTFVQLFHSLLTGANRPLKKINKLAGSVVILDEIQSIAHEKMSLIGAVLQKVAEFYGTRFILMTATRPMLLEQGTKLIKLFDQQARVEADMPVTWASSAQDKLFDQQARVEAPAPVELLTDYPSYFVALTRTQFRPWLEAKMDTVTFCNFVLEKMQEWRLENKEYAYLPKAPSVLVVVNTIQRSIDVFKQLMEMRKEKKFICKPVLVCLSTNLIPKHRRRIINFVHKCLKKDKPIILISTQTIEAGVDLDFAMGFRDLAPLSSLIQTAGRINREGRRGKLCPLYIVHLEKDCSHVYSTSEMSATKDLLKEQINESEYQLLVASYYRKIDAENGLDSTIKDIWELGVLGLNFEELKKFSLIESIGEVVDVFIEYDKEATLIMLAYRELLKKGNNINWTAIYKILPNVEVESDMSEFIRRSLLRLVGAKLSDYMIQIRGKRIQVNRPFDFDGDSSLYWVPKSELGLYYSVRTGYKAEQQVFLY